MIVDDLNANNQRLEVVPLKKRDLRRGATQRTITFAFSDLVEPKACGT